MIKEDRKNLWVQAIKWPLYSVAIIPIIISGAFNLYLHNSIRIEANINEKKLIILTL